MELILVRHGQPAWDDGAGRNRNDPGLTARGHAQALAVATRLADHGDEPAIDYPALVKVFVDEGWSGYWSSEWEGHAFLDLDEADPLDLVRKQHDLIRRSIRAALDDNS